MKGETIMKLEITVRKLDDPICPEVIRKEVDLNTGDVATVTIPEEIMFNSEALTDPECFEEKLEYGFKDHKGNFFSTRAEELHAYNISDNTFYRRKYEGWSLEKALTTPIEPKYRKYIKDDLGNQFYSIMELCDFYGFSYDFYKEALKKGYSLEEMLKKNPVLKEEEPLNIIEESIDQSQEFYEKKGGVSLSEKEVTDFNGNKFHSLEAMCNWYEIPVHIYLKRMESGWTQKKALCIAYTQEKETLDCFNQEVYIDHKGNEYPSKIEMCRYWGIPPVVFENRVEVKKWSLEKALTTQVYPAVYDQYGNLFKDEESMCEHYHINPKVYRSRRENEWTKEEALTTPIGYEMEF